MTIFDLLIYIGLIGLWIWTIAKRREYRRLAKHTAEIVDMLDKHIHNTIVDTHGTSMYWYMQKTGRFVAQGTTVAEIIEKLKQDWALHAFIVDGCIYVGPEFIKTDITS